VSVKAEQLAVDALIEWLRMKLVTKAAEVNLTRKPVLKSYPGPFEITAGMTLKLAIDSADGAFTTVTLTTGAARTAAQVAADIVVSGITATSDSDERVVLTRSTAPSSSARSVDLGEDSTGANAVFGWDPGGERVMAAPIQAPVLRGVMDGWPHQLDAQPAIAFIVVVGKRTTVPVEPNPRRDEHIVTLELAIFRPAIQQENHRSREAIAACVQCVREVLQTDAGLQLGRASSGDIVKVEVGRVVVEGMRFQQMQRGKPFGPAFDSAAMTVYVKTFERPAAS
jgi:hypothetical protein